MKRDEVGSVGKVGMEPGECIIFDTKFLESGEQDVMAHSIEGCTQVKKNKDVEVTGVSRSEEVVEEFEDNIRMSQAK
jgi:hypothetical protein